MKKSVLLFSSVFLCVFPIFTFAANDQLNFFEKNKLSHSSGNTHRHTSWYFSWGYNNDVWSNSNIHISQPGLNNHFTIHDVVAGDCPGWNTGLFNKSLMGPQYNIRIGHYFNAKHTWGIELSFDHAKYNTNINQTALVSGTISGQPFNQNEVLTREYFYYALHNGANLLMINVVRRKPFLNFDRTNFQIAMIGKLGAGVMLPHPENTIFSNTVDVGPKTLSNAFGINHGWWQFGGFVGGVEAGAQLLVHHRVYLELTDKEAYISLNNIQVYDGTASQDLWLNEVIANAGVMF